MRTILAFVLTAALYAQPPRPNPAQNELVDRLEKRVADGRASVPERITLVNEYFNRRNVEARRRHVLWLIENDPGLVELRAGNALLDSSAPLADPAGFTQALRLWREVGARTDASPKAVANAAFFLRFEDRALAKSILDSGDRAHPGDADLARTRGLLDAVLMGGAVSTAPGRFVSNPTLAKSPEAARARAEIEASRDPRLIAGAVTFVLEQYNSVFNGFDSAPIFGDEDGLAVIERWTKHAREIEPGNDEWKRLLSRVYMQQAGQIADPKWKARLYREADELDPRSSGLSALAIEEFNAGDDEAAGRDAHRLLDRADYPPPYFAHVGHTVLGRIALAHGDVATAKAELLASVPIVQNNPPYIEPNRSLAQDLVDRGERDVVIQFLEEFREFWRNDQGAINHYIKVIKAPGTHDILAYYRAGSELRGRPAPKLPIDDYSGKVVAVQFRDASCKTCADDFAAVNKIAPGHDFAGAAIDKTGHEALVRQFEIDQFPTWVLIDREGRIADYLPGRVNEQDLGRRIDQLNSPINGQRKLPAPDPLSATPDGKLAWSPVSGAESYLVQLDQRDPAGAAGNSSQPGWISDRDPHLVRVIPTAQTSVTLDPSLGETASSAIRWRVAAVNRLGAGTMSEWRELPVSKP